MNQRLRWLALGVLALTTACGGNGASLGDSPTYSGKVVNWPSPKTGSVRLNVGDSVTGFKGAAVAVDANGNFSNLVFPGKSLVTSALSVPGPQTCTTGSLTFTPNTVKIGTGTIQVLNSTTQVAGTITEATRNPAEVSSGPVLGDKQIVRLFTEGNVSVTGTCNAGGSSPTITYDINLSTGWNVIVAEITGVSGKTTTTGKYTSSALPADTKLYYSTGAFPLFHSALNP
jgi:hypothetical protein